MMNMLDFSGVCAYVHLCVCACVWTHNRNYIDSPWENKHVLGFHIYLWGLNDDLIDSFPVETFHPSLVVIEGHSGEDATPICRGTLHAMAGSQSIKWSSREHIMDHVFITFTFRAFSRRLYPKRLLLLLILINVTSINGYVIALVLDRYIYMYVHIHCTSTHMKSINDRWTF